MKQRSMVPFVQSGSAQGMTSPLPGNVAGPTSEQQPTFVSSAGAQNLMNRPSGPHGLIRGHCQGPGQMVSAPLSNTLMPMAPPSGPRNVEDLACFEKMKELGKYTDLLKRMIANAGDEDNKRSCKKLLEIITNPNLRVSMKILLKCEVALKKMERMFSTALEQEQQKKEEVLAPPSQPTPIPQPKDLTSAFQQILDAVLSSLKNGSTGHPFWRKFQQSVEALTGQPFANTAGSEPDLFEHSDDKLNSNLPGVLRRELKIVDDRFKVRVTRDPGSALSIIVHVSLMESRLPRVPPLKIFIPNDYPDERLRLLDLHTDYGGTGFFMSVARKLESHLVNLPQRFTMLELLRCWEMSVRQVSNPHYKATSEPQGKLSTRLAQAFL